jgi:hypothetical protein
MSTTQPNHGSVRHSGDLVPDWLALVRRHVESLKYGTVQITVHDGRVTEVARSEKVRFERAKETNFSGNQTTGAH